MILTFFFLWFITQVQPSWSPDANGLGVVKGIVVDSNGRPVEGATVYATDQNDPPMSRPYLTTTNANGEFVLVQVRPGKKVRIHAYEDIDYYSWVTSGFTLPSKLEMPEVEVKPGQTVMGVTVQPMQKQGRLKLDVRDADSKELVQGITLLSCRDDHPTEGGYCVGGSGSSEFVPAGVGISIKIEADDGKHVKWQYHDSKTGSLYFRVKSGETETMTIYLRKK